MSKNIPVPPAVHEYRIATTNNFTGETFDYSIPLPPELAMVYNHFVTTAIAAVAAKAGQILTDSTLNGGDCADVAAAGEMLINAVNLAPSS